MSRFRVLAAGMAVGIVATVLATLSIDSSPAFAHDELVESSPTAGQVFEIAPTEVSLRFSAEVMTMGAIVVVVDESGRDWVDGELALAGTQVDAPVQPGMPAAGYEVRWRVVSADGHPISGVIPFTVGDGAPFDKGAAAQTDAGVSEAADSAASAPPTSETQSQITSENGALRTVLIGAGGAIAAIAVFAVITLFRRRARPDGTGTPDP